MEVKSIASIEGLDINRRYAVSIYGAASTGEFCLQILKKAGVDVSCFIDDDIQKDGMLFHDINVKTPDKFFSDKGTKYAVILGSIYINLILERLSDKYNDLNITVYDISCLYEHEKYEVQKQFMRVHNPQFVWDNIDSLYSIFSDDGSRSIIDTMKMVYKNQYEKFDVYRDICTSEEQYFTKEMMSYLDGKEVSIFDGGAYWGEIISDIKRLDIRMKELFLVEINDSNIKVLKKKTSSYSGKLYLIQKGLWEKDGTVYLDGEGEQCRIVDYETNVRMEVTTIDDIIGERQVDLIKMDIEGAEMHALMGGIKTIKAKRPALAITIYHSPEDFVGIPLYLNRELNDYKFKLLHHTNEYVETILYAIPMEM